MKNNLKAILFAVIGTFLLAMMFSCADSKTFKINGEDVTVEPYGWANVEARKNENVVYEVNAGNIFWDIVLCETVVVPVWLTGWQFYEPVALKPGVNAPDSTSTNNILKK